MKILSNKTFDRDGFIRKFHKTFKEEIMPTLYNLFHKIRRATTSQLYETSVTLTSKPVKAIIRKQIDRAMFLINIEAKILNCIQVNRFRNIFNQTS